MIQAGITLLFQAGIFLQQLDTCGHGMRGSLYLITRLRFGTLSAPRPIITESQPVTAIQSCALCQSQISPLATTGIVRRWRISPIACQLMRSAL